MDFIHAVEHLSKVATEIYEESTEWYEMDRRRSAIYNVIAFEMEE